MNIAVQEWWQPRPNQSQFPLKQQRSLLPYGDGRSSSPLNQQIEDWIHGLSPNSSPTHAASCEIQSRQKTSTLKFYGAFILLSWCLAALVITQHTSVAWYELQRNLERNLLHYEQIFDQLDQIRWDSKQKQTLLRKWVKTKDALEHERSVMHELTEAAVHMYSLPDHASKQMIDEWLLHRRGGLQRHVDTLSNYLQHMSKLAVLERCVWFTFSGNCSLFFVFLSTIL